MENQEYQFCSACGAKIAKGSRFCTSCGAPVKTDEQSLQSKNEEKVCLSQPKDNKGDNGKFIQNNEVQESNIIGKNKEYYKVRFREIRNGNKGKINWASFFLGLFHAAYRDVWKEWFKASGIFWAVSLLVFLISVLISSVTTNIAIFTVGFVAYAILSTVFFVTQIIFAFKFNRIYLKHVEKKIESNNIKPDISVRRVVVAVLITALVQILVAGATVASLSLAMFSSFTSVDTEIDSYDFEVDNSAFDVNENSEFVVEETQAEEFQESSAKTETEPESVDERYTNPYSDSILLWKSYYEPLTEADLQGLSSGDLRIARNEIYAAHGRMFDSVDLQNYFAGKSWYNGTIPADQFSDSVLTEVQKENAAFIQQYENSLSDTLVHYADSPYGIPEGSYEYECDNGYYVCTFDNVPGVLNLWIYYKTQAKAVELWGNCNWYQQTDEEIWSDGGDSVIFDNYGNVMTIITASGDRYVFNLTSVNEEPLIQP